MLLEDNSNTAVAGSISNDYVSPPRQKTFENFDGGSDSDCGCGIGDSNGFGSNLAIELVIDLLCVICMAKDCTSMADQVIPSLIFGLERSGGHAGKSGGGSNLDKALKVVESEKGVLHLNPPHRGGELISEEFNEDNVGKLLALFSRTHSSSSHLQRTLSRRGEEV